ncbi:Heterokaryon incompatibility protein (HET) [Teratosphaeria destructans]|uniref:Heterokaryon incompatibility protein (HET) n=1 Tax=Teratosphaeria destructans TaxID=418781 RepID=A0A9W7ST97_9PEZI|nr:Heterokaryon incompatibility protein (HET) [Teratosphaeria destructans]
MPVGSSPRLRDSLDYEDPDLIDPRLTPGFGSVSIGSEEFDAHEPHDYDYDYKPLAGGVDPSTTRKTKRKQSSKLDHVVSFQYRTVANRDTFRLAILAPGTGSAVLEVRLVWESTKHPEREYACLSYCWGETIVRDVAILCDGSRLNITRNLEVALKSLRDPRSERRIWIDQICINQEDISERGHQVSIMKHIFRRAKEVVAFLGAEDDRSRKLFDYARKMKRGDDSPKSVLNRIMSPRQLQDAMQKLLQRPWFTRVWVIPEVAMANFTVVQCGRSIISWDNLVRLIRDIHLPEATGFDKQSSLLGNAKQRIAIITQMSASHRARLHHTDVQQLLILAKASKATDVRDMVYSFFGMTLLRLAPNYEMPVEALYAEIAHHYVNSIRWEDYYSRWHGLSDQQRTQQLMGILYSAGVLHQHYKLPSWVPDWTHGWHLAPIWCKTSSNIVIGTARDEWSTGIRCDHRAGGERLSTFETGDGPADAQRLHVSALLFDEVSMISEVTPASTPSLREVSPVSPDGDTETIDSPTLRYGRSVFETRKGMLGLATPGIQAGDILAILLGGDVPVVLRRISATDEKDETYKLLCECFVQAPGNAVMSGELVQAEMSTVRDVVLI